MSIYDKIEQYFDGDLSMHEERMLLRDLSALEGSDPRIDEALAVMLASRMTKTDFKKSGTRHRLKNSVAVAAAITAVFIGGHSLYSHTQSQNATMVAYVGGVKIEDKDEIKHIIATQLNDIGESADLLSRTISDDIDDISEALNSIDI